MNPMASSVTALVQRMAPTAPPPPPNVPWPNMRDPPEDTMQDECTRLELHSRQASGFLDPERSEDANRGPVRFVSGERSATYASPRNRAHAGKMAQPTLPPCNLPSID